MLQKNGLKYRAVKALISNGMGITAACKKADLAYTQFYKYKKQEKNESLSASTPTTTLDVSELPIEEQVIASDLSAKAKVKILTTLLNA